MTENTKPDKAPPSDSLLRLSAALNLAATTGGHISDSQALIRLVTKGTALEHYKKG